MEENIKKHIQDAINSGATREEIIETLKSAGWDDNKISGLFSELYPGESYQETQVPFSSSYQSKSEIKPQSQSKSEVKAELGPEPKTVQPQPELEPELKPQPELEPKIEPQLQPQPQTLSPKSPEPPLRPVEFPRPELTGREVGSCKYCGTPLKKNAIYCSYCGKTVISSTQEPVTKSVSQETVYNEQQQHSQQMVQHPNNKNGVATASLVLGILSIVFGFLTGIIGLILGMKGLKSSKRNMAIAGIVLSIVFGIINTTLFVILLTSLNLARTKAYDARVQNSMDQLKTSAQLYYINSSSESYEGLESDPEILKIENEIRENGGKSFSVNSGSDKYCAEVMLQSGKWRCVDSNLGSKEYETDPVCSENKYSCQ